jgi:hypothetical protein
MMPAGWVATAVTLGVPGRQASPANAEARSAPAPKIVHSEPECLAGHGAAPAATTKKDRAKRQVSTWRASRPAPRLHSETRSSFGGGMVANSSHDRLAIALRADAG